MALAGRSTPPDRPVAHVAEPQDEGQVLAKIRRRLIPFMFLLYIVSYVDRVNVGFAALQMNTDLGLSASVFGLGSGIFFIGYFLFEVPSNLIMERIGARLWIARIMVSWGLVSAGMMFMKGPASFYALRFLLGLAEAGFFPGMILYLTYWFPRRDHARAIALFMTANATAGVVGGPISGALLTMHGLGGLAGWQWLFLLEGLPAVALGLVTLAYLPDGPQEAAWLSDQERQWLKARLAADRTAHSHTASHKLAVRQVFSDRRVWGFCVLYFLIVLGLYSISFWLPQILKGLSGGSDFLVGILSALPYIVAAVGMVWIGRHSDRHQERRWHVAGPALLAASGFVLSTQTQVPALALVSISLAALGIWGSLGPFWAMSTSVLTGSTAAAGIAWINSVGNLAGFVGPYVVGLLKDATGGFGTAMVALALFLVLAAIIALRQPEPVRFSQARGVRL
jgi:MFS transporter, ACS family, tartrate transporter